jgi:hypothetical protein
MTVPTYTPHTETTETTDQRDSEPLTAAAQEPGCPACPHPLAEHDPIGARFCRATAASGATDRGCVCRH